MGGGGGGEIKCLCDIQYKKIGRLGEGGIK